MYHFYMGKAVGSLFWSNGNQNQSGLVISSRSRVYRFTLKNTPFTEKRLRRPETGIEDAIM